ncbi:MAG: hypothetical protein ABF672_06350 [Gluconobacter oxydans]|uniref:hypothetical protein n=1 Tax=Gluconobacter oxydans TaxID=442 RepID=UPI0039E8F2DB
MTRYLLAFAGLAASAAFFVSAAHAAPTGFFFPGGAREDSVMHAPGSTLDGLSVTQWGMAIDANATAAAAAQTTASAAIPKAQIGVADGVAGLDGNARVASPVWSPSLTSSPVTSAGGQPIINAGRFPIFTTVGEATASDPWLSPDAVEIGGLPVGGWAANGSANSQRARPGSLVVAGQPWGPYNAATLESLLMDPKIDPQNGVCSGDWRQGVGNSCGGDGVAQYVGVNNVQAMIVGDVSSFTATSVILKTPLTGDQIDQLRVGMYITTNIINTTTIPSTTRTDSWGNTMLPQQNYYMGNITGWSADGTTINVVGWDIPWGSSHPSGQIPQQITGDAIDTWTSNYGYPVVFIGNPNDASGRNIYVNYDGTRSGDDPTAATQTVGQAKATAHALSGDEIDLRYWGTRPNEVHLDGLTISAASMGGLGRTALSQDSFMLALSGDIHNLLILDGPDDGNIITGKSFYVHGEQGVSTVNGANRPIQTMFGFTGEVDGDSAYNFMGWEKKDLTDTNGVDGASFHLGIVKNGYARSLDPSQNGAGEIVWNHNGANVGGLSLCGASGCGMDVRADGLLTTMQQLNAQSTIAMTAGNQLQFIPSDNTGYSYWYAPPSVGGLTLSAKTYQGGDASITGYNGMFTGAVQVTGDVTSTGNIKASLDVTGQSFTAVASSGWTRFTSDGTTFYAKTSANGDAGIHAWKVTSTGGFNENLSTPSSSTASCTAGDFTDDANYHYVCVADNSWKRVALSTF